MEENDEQFWPVAVMKVPRNGANSKIREGGASRTGSTEGPERVICPVGQGYEHRHNGVPVSEVNEFGGFVVFGPVWCTV